MDETDPQGGGLLTGKHSFDAKPVEGRYGDSKLAAMCAQRYWDRELSDAIGELSRIARVARIALAELSLRWLACRYCVGSLLLGGLQGRTPPGQHRCHGQRAAAGGRRGRLERWRRRASRAHGRLQPLTPPATGFPHTRQEALARRGPSGRAAEGLVTPAARA